MLDKMRDSGLFGGDIVQGIGLSNNLTAKHNNEEDSNPKAFTQNLIEICNMFINSSLAWKVRCHLISSMILFFFCHNNSFFFDKEIMENKTRYSLSSKILRIVDDVGFQYIEKDENEDFIFSNIAMVANRTEKSLYRMCYEFPSTIKYSNNYICVSGQVWNDFDEKGV